MKRHGGALQARARAVILYPSEHHRGRRYEWHF